MTVVDVLRAADGAALAGDLHAVRRYLAEAIDRLQPWADYFGGADEGGSTT